MVLKVWLFKKLIISLGIFKLIIYLLISKIMIVFEYLIIKEVVNFKLKWKVDIFFCV